MKEMIRSRLPLLPSSTKNSLTTTTPTSAAPTIHRSRRPRRVPAMVRPSAQSVQTSDSPACTSIDAVSASAWNGTPARWCAARHTARVSRANSEAPANAWRPRRALALPSTSEARLASLQR